MDIIDNESNRPLKYENRLWSFILNLEASVELNLDSNESLLNETVLAIDYVLEHLEKKTSTPGEIQKFLTLVFYAQATLVECYTKIVRLDRANEVRTRLLLRYLFLSSCKQESGGRMFVDSVDDRWPLPCEKEGNEVHLVGKMINEIKRFSLLLDDFPISFSLNSK